MTLVAWTPTYDKNGDRTDKGDPNSYSQDAICETCGDKWHITTRYGETAIDKQIAGTHSNGCP